MKGFAVILPALLLAACSATQFTTHPSKLSVSFKRLSGGRVKVTYRVPPGINRLQLPENQAPLRQKQWRILNSRARLDPQGIALAAHDAPSSFAVIVQPVTAAPDRVYPIVVPYSNGGALINTAAFVPANACRRTVLRFAPRQGERAVLRGRVYAKTAAAKAFCSGDHDGSWAYLGASKITRRKGFLLIADPGAPAWIANGTRAALQHVLGAYPRGLGVALSVRPTVYLGYSPGRAQNAWYHGDVLAFYTVRLSYVGKAWQNPSSAASNLLSSQLFIAHEAFHFWNGGIKSERPEPHGAWLVEGGAQLAALFTAKRAGWLSSGDFLHRLNGDLQRCLLETGDRPWAALDGQKISGRSYYDCGVIFNLMAAALDNPAHPAQGFFKQWRELLHSNSAHYSITDFLRIASHNAHDAAASKRPKQAIKGRSGSLSRPINRLFTALKIPVRTVIKLTPADLSASAVLKQFLMPLLRNVCKPRGRYGFWTRKGYIKMDVPARCEAFSQTKLLVAIGGAKLTKAPLSAWRNAYAECRRNSTVTFRALHGQPPTVPCHKSIPKPPRLLRLEAYRAGPADLPFP